MKKVLCATAVMGGILLMGGGQVSWALSPETAMLLDLLKAKGVINENEAAEFTKALEAKSAAAMPVDDGHYHSVQSLSDREEKREEKSVEPVESAVPGKGGFLAGVASNISFSSLLEANMTSGRISDSEGEKTSSSDLSLVTAQLNADAFFSHYVSGHLSLLYEEDPADLSNNNIVLDEALVGVKGGEACPIYVNVGRMYVPFGHFESHFVSDPTTLILGETNDTAVVGGYIDDIFDLGGGFFKGKVSEEGKNEQINSMVVSAVLRLPKGSDDKLAMKGGASYLSNMATSDGLEPYAADDMDDDDATEIVTPAKIDNMVGGASAFLSLAYAETFFFDAEFLGAIDGFVDGDLSFVDDKNHRPQAWNLEAAVRAFDKVECAIRYGGSDEAGPFLADNEYGAVVLYNIFDYTSLAVEYLFQEFRDNSENSQTTMQLAVEF